MKCLTPWGQRAMELLRRTPSLPGGSEIPAMHCFTAWGQWALKLLPVGVWAVELLQCTAALLGGSGQLNSCNALPHRLGAVGSGTPTMHCLGGVGSAISCNTLPHCLGAMGSGTTATHCQTALGQWTVQLLSCTATLLGGSGLWNCYNALCPCLGAVGSASFCNPLPKCHEAVGSGTPRTHCLTARGLWAVKLVQCTT